MFDKDGYPTDETLLQIEAWKNTVHEWLDFCKEAFEGQSFGVVHDFCDEEKRTLIFITEGWSGCESVIGAMKQNILYFITWRYSASGGVHTFQIPQICKELS